jgi:HEAT repeat protein
MEVAAVLLAAWLVSALQLSSANAVSASAAPGMDGPSQLWSTGHAPETAIQSDNGFVEAGQKQQTPPTGAAGRGGELSSKDDPTGARVEELIRATRAPKWKDRWDAVNELGNLKDPRGIPALVERALRDDNPHPRWRSLWALSSIDRKATDAVPPFVEALKSEDPNVVHNAAVALGFFRRAEARDQLLRTLGDPIVFRRWEAVYSFRGLGNAAVIAALIPLLDSANESSIRVRGETALVLGRIGDATVVPALMRALRTDASREVRWRAGLALKSVGNTCLTGELQDVLSSEAETMVREQISKTLAAIGRSKRRAACPDGAASSSP